MIRLGSLKISHKVLLAMGMLGVVVIAATLFSTNRMRAIETTYGTLLDREAAAVSDMERANQRVVNTTRLLYQYVAETDEAEMAKVNTQLQAVTGDFHKLAEQAATEAPTARPKIAEAAKLYDQAMADSRLVLALALNNNDKANDIMRGKVTPALVTAQDKLSIVSSELDRDLDRASGAANAMVDRTIILTLVAVAVAFALCWILSSQVIIHGVSRPLKRMSQAMRQLSQGDTQVVVDGQDQQDEVGEMARALEVFRANKLRADQLEAAHRVDLAAKERRRLLLEQHTADFQSRVTQTLDQVTQAASRMHGTAQTMRATAQNANQRSAMVSGAAAQASENVQTVAAATEQLAASIKDIAHHVEQSSRIASTAVHESQEINNQINSLSEASQRIGEVVALITSIASQTNLLALNATIEAARAGEAGKGFAVVAGEVKTLANQTGKATEEISSHINGIQERTDSAVAAIGRIGETISNINQIAGIISAAVEQQGASTQDIARNVQMAAHGTADVTGNIHAVAEAANSSEETAAEVLSSSQHLADQAAGLRALVENFLRQIGEDESRTA